MRQRDVFYVLWASQISRLQHDKGWAGESCGLPTHTQHPMRNRACFGWLIRVKWHKSIVTQNFSPSKYHSIMESNKETVFKPEACQFQITIFIMDQLKLWHDSITSNINVITKIYSNINRYHTSFISSWWVDISLFNQFLVVWKFLLTVSQTCQNQSFIDQSRAVTPQTAGTEKYLDIRVI